MLDTGEAKSRAELAKRAGVSAVRVSQGLGLLRLHPTILDAIRALPPGTPERLISERKLRPLTRLPQSEQLRQVVRLVPALLKGRAVA